jgi:hypothetical protein
MRLSNNSLAHALMKPWRALLLALVVLGVMLALVVNSTHASSQKQPASNTSPLRTSDEVNPPAAPAGPHGPIALTCTPGHAGVIGSSGPAGPQGPIGVSCASGLQG